jgi:hypothetical protein
MAHFESLLVDYYDRKGYVVHRNTKVPQARSRSLGPEVLHLNCEVTHEY